MKHRPHFTSLFVVLSILFLGWTAGAQSTDTAAWAAGLLDSSANAPIEDKLKVIQTIADRYEASGSLSIPERELVAFLRDTEAYLRLEPDGLTMRVNRAVTAREPESRKSELQASRIELLKRFELLSRTAAPQNISADDARQFVSALQTFSQALDDMRDPSLLGGKSSALSKLLSRAGGLANFAAAIEDPDAKNVVGSFTGTLGTISHKLERLDVSVPNPMKAFDFPLSVAASQIQVSRDGYRDVTAAMNDVSKAIGGDAEALSRLPGRASQVEKTLSKENFGRAMANAMTDRLLSSVPFARTLAKWISPAGERPPAVERFLRLETRCAGDGRFEIQQKDDNIRAIAVNSVAGCFQAGELLFEGSYLGDRKYKITIHKIWDREPRRVMSGELIVQNTGFLRMQSPQLDSPGSKYLFK